MDTIDLSILSSAKFSTIYKSIEDAKTNKLTLDNISNHYIFEEEVHMSFSILRKYENIIRSNISKIPLPTSCYLRPEYLSQILYKTTDLWYLILFVNNITSPYEFKREEVWVVNPSFIETFIKIINREKKMIESRTTPTLIYKHIIKDLNSPSKQVLSSDFDKELENLTDLKDYIDITDLYFNKSNFVEYSNHIIRGKLIGDFYNVDGNGNDTFIRKSLCNSFNKVDDYKDIGENVRIVKNGYLKPTFSDTYEIKVWSDGNFQIYLNDNSVVNHIGEHGDLSNPKTKNLFEEYSLNSDFKRRNLDFWNVSIGNIIYDVDLNKNILQTNLNTNNLDEKLIASVDIPLNAISFENEGDFVFDVEYLLGDGNRYHKLVQEIIITKLNDTVISYKQESMEYNEINNNMSKSRIVFPRQSLTNSEIKSIRLNLSFKSNVANLNKTTDLKINSFKIATVISTTYVVELDNTMSYKFKSIYYKNESNTDLFNVLWKRSTSTNFSPIPEEIFYNIYDYGESYEKYGSIAVESYENNVLYEQFLSKTLDLTEDLYKYEDSSYYRSINISGLNKTYNFIFSTIPSYLKTNIKLIGNNNHQIDLYIDGVLKGSKSYTETEKIINCSSTTSNSCIIKVTLKNGTSLDFDIKRQENGFYIDLDSRNLYAEFNKNLIYTIPTHKFLLNRYNCNKRTIYNMICTNPLSNDWILDLTFKHSYGVQFTRKGMFGIIFNIKNSNSYYMLLLRCNGVNTNAQSGIYKISNRNMIPQTFDEFEDYYKNMTLMKEIPIELDDTTDKNIKILKKNGRILLCQDNSRYPFIVLNDMFAPYMEGLLGFHIFEQDDIKLDITLWG